MLKCTHVTAPQIQRTHSSALPLCQVLPRILLGGGGGLVSPTLRARPPPLPAPLTGAAGKLRDPAWGSSPEKEAEASG